MLLLYAGIRNRLPVSGITGIYETTIRGYRTETKNGELGIESIQPNKVQLAAVVPNDEASFRFGGYIFIVIPVLTKP